MASVMSSFIHKRRRGSIYVECVRLFSTFSYFYIIIDKTGVPNVYVHQFSSKSSDIRFLLSIQIINLNTVLWNKPLAQVVNNWIVP